VPIRMALLALLLGAREVDIPEGKGTFFIQKRDYSVYKRGTGLTCRNNNCVSRQGTETRYIKPRFYIVSKAPLTLRCIYCEQEIHPQYIASSKWHQGLVEKKRYYRADSTMLNRIQPENLIIFDSENVAQNFGFKPARKGFRGKGKRGNSGS